MAKIRLHKKCYNFETNEDISLKIWYDDCKDKIYVE